MIDYYPISLQVLPDVFCLNIHNLGCKRYILLFLTASGEATYERSHCGTCHACPHTTFWPLRYAAVGICSGTSFLFPTLHSLFPERPQDLAASFSHILSSTVALFIYITLPVNYHSYTSCPWEEEPQSAWDAARLSHSPSQLTSATSQTGALLRRGKALRAFTQPLTLAPQCAHAFRLYTRSVPQYRSAKEIAWCHRNCKQKQTNTTNANYFATFSSFTTSTSTRNLGLPSGPRIPILLAKELSSESTVLCSTELYKRTEEVPL
jgi:hypothetical protein